MQVHFVYVTSTQLHVFVKWVQVVKQLLKSEKNYIWSFIKRQLVFELFIYF